MNSLSTDVDKIKNDYKTVFLETSEEFIKKIDKMDSNEFSNFLNGEAIQEVLTLKKEISDLREESKCIGCGACCKLACSEFSPEELKDKAEKGDSFANQFINTFSPYEKDSDAQKIYPEYIELLKDKAKNEKTYFYHCLKVTKDNRCSDYENRPQICRDFPDNPIAFLPKTCGYSVWKEKAEEKALKAHALIEIISFYMEKLKSI